MELPLRAEMEAPFTPPRYTIDLSLAPRERYKILATHYKPQLQALTILFDELLLSLALPPKWLPTINRVSRYILRKVHDSVQTQELRGISDVTSIPMYLLVAFNVVLDLLMGCTSGAALSRESGESRANAKMLHFRTLDWTMDPLRRIVVQLDFVHSKSSYPSQILASSITYLGFVGVLTGVKQGLSMSLNFRAVHNAKTKAAHFRFYLHHLLVLTGHRPSIASLLRQYLIGNTQSSSNRSFDPASVAADLQSRHTTAAYIILSDGNNTLTMEKDYATAKIKSSSTFIAITNHDKDEPSNTEQATPTASITKTAAAVRQPAGLAELIEESTDRLRCIERKWAAKVKRSQRASERSTRSSTRDDPAVSEIHVTKSELIKWLNDWPTTNECTHYAAVLDPSTGQVAYSIAYPQPLQEPSPHL